MKQLLTRSPGPLSKPHQEYDNLQNCISCHASRTGKEVVHKKCLECHQEISVRIEEKHGYHADKPECKTCHTEHNKDKLPEFDIFAPKDWLKTFNHDETNYPLIGSHQTVECNDCHTTYRKHFKTKEPSTSRSYLDAPNDCYTCHKKVYEHRFSKKKWLNCTECHSTSLESWTKMARKLTFSHDETEYPLEGLHIPVACKACHKPDPKLKRLTTFAPLKFSQCTHCHADPHKGKFGDDCTTCHNVYRKWDDIIPTREGGKPKGLEKSFDHDQTKFPLKGYHEKVDCKACHFDPAAKFKVAADQFDECSDCHSFPHGDQFAKLECTDCHAHNRKFNKTSFNLDRHNKTRFPLTGKHQVLECNKCHFTGKFESLQSTECTDCHRNPHDRRQIDHPCSFCHVTTDFSWIQFDHNKNTKFSLTGKHRDVSCTSCHVNEIFKNMPASNEKPNCQSCHDSPHGTSMSNQCQECHRTEGFYPAKTFDHLKLGRWQLEGRHAELPCQKCHPQHLLKSYEVFISAPNLKATDCINCHKDIHKGEFGKNCASCHTASSFSIEQEAQVHDLGFMKLEGTHNQLACKDCHRSDTNLQGLSLVCGSCHQKNDPHLGKLGQSCSDCHRQTAWLPSTFKHNQTGFRLTGAHRYAQCSDCHKNQIYEGLPNDCFFCHSDSYIRGIGSHNLAQASDCSDCHSQISWKIRRRSGL